TARVDDREDRGVRAVAGLAAVIGELEDLARVDLPGQRVRHRVGNSGNPRVEAVDDDGAQVRDDPTELRANLLLVVISRLVDDPAVQLQCSVEVVGHGCPPGDYSERSVQ